MREGRGPSRGESESETNQRDSGLQETNRGLQREGVGRWGSRVTGFQEGTGVTCS